jgi:parallel beta-helix repeat protein
MILAFFACDKEEKVTIPPRLPKMIVIPIDYPTIQQGINESVDGDTIIVQPGTYSENIYFLGNNIILGSRFLTTGDLSYISLTVIDGQLAGPVVTFPGGEDSTCVLSGFTLRRGNSNFGGGIFCVTSNPTLSRNVIIDNFAQYSGGGIYLWGSDPVIANNTVSDNFAGSKGGGIGLAYSFPVIRNTIVWGDSAQDGTEFIIIDTGIPVLKYCNIEGGWQGEGNIDCNPVFCNPDMGDYYLADSSCCVGAGENGEDIGALGIGCE